MVKILGLIDIFAALTLFSITREVFHVEAFLLIVVLLLIKGGFSFRDVGGITDIVAFLLIVISFFFSLPIFLLIPVAVLLLVKGAVSLLS